MIASRLKAIVVRARRPEVLKLEDMPDPKVRISRGSPASRRRQSGRCLSAAARARKPALPFILDPTLRWRNRSRWCEREQVAIAIVCLSWHRRRAHGRPLRRYAEHAVCRLRPCYQLPKSISRRRSDGRPYATAPLRHFTALERARRAVLIHGATGGVGLAAMIAHAQA